MEETVDVLDEFGRFTGKVEKLSVCHSQGLWHRAVFGLIVNESGDILLQQRSEKKKLWPGKWDITVGGHVQSGELGKDAIIRETKEELGLNITEKEINFLVSSTSRYNNNGYINNHYDECFIIKKDVNINELKLQESEVSDVRFFSKTDILDRINNNYDGLTEKTITWNIIKTLIENNRI